MDDNIQPIAVGQSVILSFGANPEGLTVRIAPRTVEAARETPLQKFIYTPQVWASTVATLFVVVLLGTAIAIGTIRPTPPPLPTPAPGEPTPTPDTRPRISLPGFQLVAPEAPPTATPQPRGPAAGTGQTPAGVATLTPFNSPSTDDPPADTPPQPCGLFGLGCPPTARTTPSGVVPGPSPVPPGGGAQDRALGLRRIAPPPGSNLDDALRAASVVDKNFSKALNSDLATAGHKPSTSAHDSNEEFTAELSTDSGGP